MWYPQRMSLFRIVQDLNIQIAAINQDDKTISIFPKQSLWNGQVRLLVALTIIQPYDRLE